MEGEVARVLTRPGGGCREGGAGGEVNAERGAGGRTRGREHRRGSHNAEMEELQRRLYALMRDREEALARFRHERNRLGDELREADGADERVSGDDGRRGTGGGVRPRGARRDAKRTDRDRRRVGSAARFARRGGRLPSSTVVGGQSRAAASRDRRRRSPPRRGAAATARCLVRARRVVADPGPAPAAPAPSGSAFAADVGVEFVRLVAIEFESIKRVVSREGRSRVGERAGERARGRRRAARGVVLDVLLRRASSRLGLFDWVCLTRHGEALRFTKLIRYKFSYPARRVSRLDTRAPRPPSRRERTPPTKRLPSSTRSRRVVAVL